MAVPVRTALRRRRRRLFDFACTLPALILFAVFTYYPILELFRISFTDWNLSRPTWQYVGLKNYSWLFTGRGWSQFSDSLRLTVLYTASEVLFTVVLGLALALLFSRMTRYFDFLRVSIVIPKYILISSTALCFMWLYNDMYGVFNFFLRRLGLSGVNWLGSRDTALLSLIFFSAWRSAGYAMLIYLSAMNGISRQYLEAAAVDGANFWQQLIHIQLPLLAPTTLFLVITTTTSAMKVFQAVDILTQGGPYKSTMVLVYQIYKFAFEDHRLDRAAAVGCVFFVILLIFTAVTMKWSDRSVNYDA